ncbi:MAG: four-helix bundle copper-binding protein [Cytophagales bacterium]
MLTKMFINEQNIMSHQQFKVCIDACNDCADECEHCATA